MPRALSRASRATSRRLPALAWVAASCVVIVINGGRGLPQYFVQANPALAIAAALGAWHVYKASRTRWVVSIVLAAALLALSRVVPLEKAVDATVFDARHAAGTMTARRVPGALRRPAPDRQARAGRGQAPRAVPRGAQRARRHGVHLRLLAGRARAVGPPSASRFFWSRPLVVGFNEGQPGYGAAGLLDDLRRNSPAVVVLQVNDWQLEGSTPPATSRPAPNWQAGCRRATTASLIRTTSKSGSGGPGPRRTRRR